MINDIEAARSRLDRLYQIMDVDEIADRMREIGSPAVEKTEQTNFLYSIRVVRAENLQALDKNGLSDPYVVLEINQRETAKTRTVYKTLNPRWDQSFDIWLNERDVEALAMVYDEDMIGSNRECGSVWFKLSPSYFDDYQMHDLNLSLHPQGKLHLRVSLVGEKDDIQFWFVKAFRTLKRSENDAAGIIVDQVHKKRKRELVIAMVNCDVDLLTEKKKQFYIINLFNIRWVDLCDIVYPDAHWINCYEKTKVSSPHSVERITKWNLVYKNVKMLLHLSWIIWNEI